MDKVIKEQIGLAYIQIVSAHSGHKVLWDRICHAATPAELLGKLAYHLNVSFVSLKMFAVKAFFLDILKDI